MIEKAKLVKIVGAGNVSQEPAALDEYSSDMSFVNAVKPDCVVKPRSTGSPSPACCGPSRPSCGCAAARTPRSER